MKDNEQVRKIVEAQEKLFPKLEQLDQDGVLTSDVYEAMEEGKHWNEQVEHHNASNEEIRRWEPHKLARLLHKHISEYPRGVKQEVQEYCFLVEKLRYDGNCKL